MLKKRFHYLTLIFIFLVTAFPSINLSDYLDSKTARKPNLNRNLESKLARGNFIYIDQLEFTELTIVPYLTETQQNSLKLLKSPEYIKLFSSAYMSPNAEKLHIISKLKGFGRISAQKIIDLMWLNEKVSVQ